MPRSSTDHGFINIVTAVCWFGLFAEGYDMGALGAVLPTLMADPAWHLSPAGAGTIASATLAGMFFGGYGFGVLSDRVGRKGCFLLCLGLFSLASGLAALAPTPLVLGGFRFLAGVGVGGIVPIAAALTSEFAPPGQANRHFALMYSGYSLGILASALVAFGVVQTWGWRPVLGLGAVPLVLLPILARALPESLVFLVRAGRIEQARGLAQRFGIELPDGQSRESFATSTGLAALFAAGRVRATMGFWMATFFGMVLVYGLNTWLPKIMRDSGYDLGPSILFLGVFALASSLGGMALGWLADRLGQARTSILAFGMGSIAILALAVHWTLPVTYLVVALAGVGTVAAAVMVTSYLSHYHPANIRATAVGSCVSFSRFGAVCGPLLGGAVAQVHAPVWLNFYLFALTGLLAAAAVMIIPRMPSSR